MPAKPKISIIVPVYNSERTLDRCISSLLSQSFTDFELILVNDGSTDSSAGIIDRYAKTDNRISTIDKVNGGVSSARNAGLDAARGEYILFCDSDDEVYREWASTAYEGLRYADFLVTGIFARSSEGTVKEIHPPVIAKGKNTQFPLLVESLWEIPMFGWLFNKGFKRSVIEEHHLRFDEDLRYREDDLFVSEYLEHINNFIINDVSNYVYYLPDGRKDYGQDVTTCAEKLFNSQIKIFKGDLSERVCQLQFWTVKGAIVHNLLNKKKPSKRLIQIFKHFTNKLDYRLPLRSRLTYAILSNNKLFVFAIIIVNLINKR